MLDRDDRRIWSVERAKYAQWQHRTGLNDAALARLGITEQQRSAQAAARGARLLGWPYLQQLMSLLNLDTIVGPSVLEAPPTARWTTAEDDFTWAASDSPLIFLEWIPPARRAEILSRCQSGQLGIITRRSALSSDLEGSLDDGWVPTTVHGEGHFVHKPNWWATGNQ
eukprot:1408853-Rhodomonas_salina.1